MSIFSLKKRIISCDVDIELLKQLEEYLTKQVPRILNLNTEFLQNFSLVIEDQYGREELKNTSEYRFSMLHDYTKEIRLQVVLYKPKLHIIIIFRNSIFDTEMQIDVEAENSREVSISIYEGLNRIIGMKSNSNKIFHPHTIIKSIVFGAFFYVFPLSIAYLLKKQFLLGCLFSLASLFVFSYTIIGFVYKPYIQFITKRSLKLQSNYKWFISSLLSFVIFGSILTFFRKKIFGF